MQTKLISVIVPIYNAEKYLTRCVNSLQKQTYTNLEIILVNDGSIDNSLEICNKLKEQNSSIIVINQKNEGVSSARNAGLEIARGDYITFLDSDDWIAEDTYEYLVELVEKNDADVGDIGAYQVKSIYENIPKKKENIIILEKQDILKHYLHRGMYEQHGAPFSVWRKLYKKELFFDDTKGFKVGTINEDICFNFRILRKCNKIVVSNVIKCFYFKGEETSITSGKLKKRDLDLLTVSNELVGLAEETKNKKIIKLAKMKCARSDFSLLARIAILGIDESIKRPEVLISKLQRRLQKNIILLLESPMPVSRKAISVAFAIDYKLCLQIIQLIRKFNRQITVRKCEKWKK